MKLSLTYLKFILCLITITLLGCSDNNSESTPALVTQQYSEGVIKAADISNEGLYTLISDNKQVCLWNNQTNTLVYQCITGIEGQLIELLGISDNNQYFYTSNRVNVHLYHLATGRMETVWSAGDNIINDIAMSADETTLVLGFRSGQASIVGVNSQQINTFDVHRLDINRVSISRDGKLAFTGSSDKLANLWHTDTGEVTQSFKHKMRVNHVTLTPDAKMAFSLDAVDDRFFWTLPQGKLFTELKASARFLEFNHGEFSTNKQWYLTASPKQKIRLWNTLTGELHSQWLAFKNPNRKRSSVLTVKFVSDNQIASITSDGVFQLWQLLPTR